MPCYSKRVKGNAAWADGTRYSIPLPSITMESDQSAILTAQSFGSHDFRRWVAKYLMNIESDI